MPVMLALALSLALAGCGRHEPRQPEQTNLPTATVRLHTISPESYASTEKVIGTVRSKLHAHIEAKVSGRIKLMPVIEGMTVHSGDLIAQLDEGEIKAKLDQALAQRDVAEKELERFTLLLEKAAATRQEFDAVESQARVKRAAVAETEFMLGYTTVTAPYSGVVTRKLADVGDLAGPGKPLVELQDPTVLRLEADVPEALIHLIQPNAKLGVHLSSETDPIPGTVSEIAPAATPGSRTFLVKIDLPPQTRARPGQFGRVTVPLDKISTLRIPHSAVVQRGQMELLFVETDGRAAMRIVKTGAAQGDTVELLAGAEAGERIVVDGTRDLRDGQPLEIRP